MGVYARTARKARAAENERAKEATAESDRVKAEADCLAFTEAFGSNALVELSSEDSSKTLEEQDLSGGEDATGKHEDSVVTGTEPQAASSEMAEKSAETGVDASRFIVGDEVLSKSKPPSA